MKKHSIYLSIILWYGMVRCSQGLAACPKVRPGEAGICAEMCKTDSNCTGGLKCCKNGCGAHVCTQPVFEPCKPGETPLKNTITGKDLYCGRGGQRCPGGSYCDIHPTDGYAKCCPKEADSRPCKGEKPLTNTTTGQDLYCGRGGQRCPSGSYCDIHPTDVYAKCCKNKVDPLPCKGETPLTNITTGLDLYCGRGGQRCPSGSYCDIHPTDVYAKCCRNKVDPPPCKGETPLTNTTTGLDLYCGRGGQRCPNGSYCDIHPTDVYAKCCKNKGSQLPSLYPFLTSVLLYWLWTFVSCPLPLLW